MRILSVWKLKWRLNWTISSLQCHSPLRIHENTTTHASGAADSRVTVQFNKQGKMHANIIIHKHVWRFQQRGWLAIFYPALTYLNQNIQTVIYREGRSASELLKAPRRLTWKRRNWWIKALFLFSLHTKSIFYSFVKLRLNHWFPMDYFNDVFTTFLGLEHVSCVAVYGGSESSQIPSKIFVFVFRRWTKVLRVWNNMRWIIDRI